MVHLIISARQEKVTINILDVNDEPPKIVGAFPKSSVYPNGLPENMTGLFYKGRTTLDGAFIYCVTAKDNDTNAKLTYSFTPMDEKVSFKFHQMDYNLDN